MPNPAVEWVRNRWRAQGALLTAQTATTNGLWLPVEGLYPLFVTVHGSATGLTALLYVTNETTKPADSDNNYAAIKTFSGVDNFQLDAPVNWIKLRVSAIGGGSVSAEYQAAGISG